MSTHDEAKNEREESCLRFVSEKLSDFSFKRPLNYSENSFPDFLVKWNGVRYLAEHTDASGARIFIPDQDSHLNFDTGRVYQVDVPYRMDGVIPKWKSFAKKGIKKGIKSFRFDSPDSAWQKYMEIMELTSDSLQDGYSEFLEFSFHQFSLISWPIKEPSAQSILRMRKSFSGDESHIHGKREKFDQHKRNTNVLDKVMLVLDSQTGWRPDTINFEWADAVILVRRRESIELLKG